MNEANQAVNWIRRRRRMIFVLVPIVFAVALFSLYLLYMANQAKSVREQAEKLLANPILLPETLASVKPQPGARDEMVNQVCATVWLNVHPPGSAKNDVATTPATLYIDGAFMPGDVIYASNPPVQCWRGDFKGLHLAEVTFQSAMSGTLNYQWAFIGR